jgi:hypothetical protein
MAKHLYIFENKILISLITYLKIYSDYYLITIATCTYQKSLAFESTSVKHHQFVHAFLVFQ